MVQYTESRPVSMRGVDCKYPRRTSNVVNRPSRLVQTRCRHNSRFFSYYKFPTYFVFCQSWWSPIPTRTAPKGLGSRGMDGRRKIPILLAFACPLDVCAVITPMPITATSDDNLDLSQTVDMGARSQAGLFRLKLTTPGLFPPLGPGSSSHFPCVQCYRPIRSFPSPWTGSRRQPTGYGQTPGGVVSSVQGVNVDCGYVCDDDGAAAASGFNSSRDIGRQITHMTA